MVEDLEMSPSQAEQLSALLAEYGVKRTAAEIEKMGALRAGNLLGIARRNHQTEIVRSHHAFATPNR